MGTSKPIFCELNADELQSEATEIESLCMNCHSNGTTRLLLTKIPFYKEVVLMSFSCDECGFQNNEIQSGAPIAEKGIRIKLDVRTERDLNRQVVKSDYTSVKIVEIDFEIPAQSQKGEVTTIEGILDRSERGLAQDQPVRRIEHPEAAAQIDEFIQKIRKLKELREPFTVILEDISGNSFIENVVAPQVDPQCTTTYFSRNKNQNHVLGIYDQEEIKNDKENAILEPIGEDDFTLEDLQGEVLQLPTNCPNCNSPCQTNMKLTNIPHFKEVVIMATTCDICGHRTNEVKSSGGIEPQGLHIEVDVKCDEDFKRDVLKSETCSLKIPQLELEVGPYALGGRFTTVEGLIVAVKEQLSDPKYSHIFGDSQEIETKTRFEKFLGKFNDILSGKLAITVVLDDPAGNSYIQSFADNGQVDNGLRITHYERTFDQNDELGLNDMKTENYEKTS